jgi:hypothetical protein
MPLGAAGSETPGLNSNASQKRSRKLGFISKVSNCPFPVPTLPDNPSNPLTTSLITYTPPLSSTTDAIIYNRTKDHSGPTGQWFNELLSTTPWFADVVPNFKVLPQSSLPTFADSGTSFTSVCINTAVYLPYLVSQCLANGVVLKRAILNHINDASSLHHSGKKADVIVNCTGLLASKLGGE